MLEPIKNLPSTVVGFIAKGEVTKEDYQQTFIPALEDLVQRTNELRLLLVFDSSLKDVKFGAWMNDVWTGIKHFKHWRKIAVVNDQGLVTKFYSTISAFLPGEIKTFQGTDLDIASIWVAEE